MQYPRSDPPRARRLHAGTPILEKIPEHPWESNVAFNPACVLVDDKPTLDRIIPRLPFDRQTRNTLSSHKALCFLLYRAQGRKTPEHDHTRSSVGLAVLTPYLCVLARHNAPVLLPDRDYDNLGVEDPRITRLDDRFFMFYTAYSLAQPTNKIRIAIATSEDLIHWEKHGLLRGEFNEVDNKNAMLFPDRIHGEYALLHRPMTGAGAMSIHLATGSEVFGTWRSRGVLMEAIPNPRFADTWIGGGAPPLRLDDGRYLLLYHIGNRAADRSREYDLGIAICDPEQPGSIVKRTEPLLRPEFPAETQGDPELGVNNVVFICGAYFFGGNLYFPYAGSDSVVLGGKIAKTDLHRYVTS